ncbi:MAG TPA: NAD(P)-dependent oxidoreductase [Spirochaetia bacterium]|nr:NAD(P)-dependent oxidoreductase [Spirochaetales bacterium]HRW23737.1 NAD(P)-dependent oxidoreductase [Spirochaetia bacterium]
MKTMGFPRMMKELGERRAFLPEFFGSLQACGAPVTLESGYGSRLGYDESDYRSVNKNVRIGSLEEAYGQDLVVILRAPRMDELEMIKRGAVLVSMLHYPTRAHRNEVLKELGIKAVSLDSVRDDFMNRIVFNPTGTSANGMELAFQALAEARLDFFSHRRRPLQVGIMGLGPIGQKAARWAGRFGSHDLLERARQSRARGVIVHMLPRNFTCERRDMERLLPRLDILVDATTREDPYKYIVDNRMIGLMKPDAVILDLTADPYLTDGLGTQVKAIEGIPTGDLSNTVIRTDDPLYEQIPDGVSTEHRRTVVSCNAWPGVKPEECMRLYGIQIAPLLQKLVKKDPYAMKADAPDYFERAIARSTLEYYEANERKR